jgi:hypothetical protein
MKSKSSVSIHSRGARLNRQAAMRSTTPPGWSKTLADLLAENRNLSGEEIEWARTFEREQLRSWARFPRPGEVYELIGDSEISYVTHWRAPFTGGGKGMLQKGTRIRVSGGTGDLEPIGVYADPIDKPRVEAELIPEADRLGETYAGFSLFIRTTELNRLFHLVTKTDDVA